MASTSKVNPNGNGFVSMEEFIRTRDSVVTGLTKLNGAISTLISAYVTHTNTLLNSSGQAQAVLDTNQLTEYLASAGLAVPKGNVEASGSKDKKKRPKKEKDPNAPKRPLTAFFLFSTRAREHIKSDLGTEATPVEINNEILRRWNEMDGTQKERWKEIYNQNYDAYKKEVEAYRIKTGQDLPVEPAGDHDAPADPAQLNAVPGADESEEEEEEESSSDEEEPEPPKEPSPPPKKTKAAGKGKKKGAAAEVTTAPAVASPSPSAQLQGPARSTTAIPLPALNEKRKKGKEESLEQPKKKSRKSDAAAAAPPPTPAPAPAAAPAEKKKKKSKKSEA